MSITGRGILILTNIHNNNVAFITMMRATIIVSHKMRAATVDSCGLSFCKGERGTQ